MLTQVLGKKVILRGSLAHIPTDTITKYVIMAKKKYGNHIAFETVYMCKNRNNTVHVEVFDHTGKVYTVCN